MSVKDPGSVASLRDGFMSLLMAVVLAVGLWPESASAQAQPSFGSCDSRLFLAQNQPTRLFSFDTSSNPFVVNPIGPASSGTYNAIAFNPVDFYIYGLQGPAPARIIRIGSDGSVASLGTITGFPANAVPVIGEFGPGGTFYTLAGGRLYRINVTARTQTSVALTPNLTMNVQDLAWHDGMLYAAGFDNGPLYRINPTSGQVTQTGSTGVTNGFGGMFGASNGLFGSRNAGGFYQFDLTTGAATLISDLQGSGNNDGAKCVTTPLSFPADVAIEKDNGSDVYVPGTSTTYTITVRNNGPFGVVGARVVDTLPVGISSATWTCGNTTGGGVCSSASGTGGIDTLVNLPVDGTATFSLTMAIPATFRGDLLNTATITNPAGTPDPVSSNNSAEDLDTIAPAAVEVTKTSSPQSGSEVTPGQTLSYLLTAVVSGGPTTSVLTLTDTLGDGLSFGEVTSSGAFTCTGALVCTLPADTLAGSYAVAYTATVDDDATGTVGNSVVATGGGDNPPTCTDCTTEHEIEAPTITVVKSANPADGSEVVPGQTLTYTLTATVATSATTAPLVLTDTLGTGLTLGAVTSFGDFNCTGTLVCTLAAGAMPGSYPVTYTATVNANATGTVGNSVAATGGGNNPPVCTDCTTEHEIEASTISVVKSANPADGSEVVPGQTLTYTLTATIATSATTEPLVLTDTLGSGLTFGAVTSSGDFSCTGTLVCTLAAGAMPGTYPVTYTATVNADATGAVGNTVVATGGSDIPPTCTDCSTEHEVEAPTITVVKSADPADGSEVVPGQTLTYTLTATVATSATTAPLVLTDTLGSGLTFGAVTSSGDFSCTGTLVCTLAAGALPGTYPVTYTATVNADATGTVGNSVVASGGGDNPPVCTDCTTEHDIEAPSIMVVKSANPAGGSEVAPGQTLTYTLTATVATSATTAPLVLTDTLGSGLTFGSIVDAGDFSCTGNLVCTLAAGAMPGSYPVTYTATVNADATGTVGNSVVASGGGDNPPVCADCSTEHEVEAPTITVVKSANPVDGSEVLPGQTLTYTLTATVATSATTAPLVLTDTPGTGLTFDAVVDAGAFSCSGSLVCTLPAGTLPGTFEVTYTATVDADATGTVGNSVVASGGGDNPPTCATCTTDHGVQAPTITLVKSADPANGAEVRVGDVVTYTLTVTVDGSATTTPLTLADTLSGAQTLLDDRLVVPAGGACQASASGLDCTLAAGSLPGAYVYSYAAEVGPTASGTIGNSVIAQGGGVDGEPDCTACTTTHPVADALVSVSKRSDPGDGAEVAIGDRLAYTLEVRVEYSAITTSVRLVDTPGTGLRVESVPAGCQMAGAQIVCELPAGTVPGVYAFAYEAVVDPSATGEVRNSVVSEYAGRNQAVCAPCGTSHRVLDQAELRVVKTAGARTARVGDLVRYTLTIENLGRGALRDGVLLDTPPAGFSYVEGSMQVLDDDEAFTLASARHPLHIGGLDIAPGGQATVVYLLRVGAGVRGGVQVNQAVAQDAAGQALSNVATAQVSVEADPLLDDSLVFGTVFDDRDGDGWQDAATMTGVRIQGGFAASAYVPGSTTIDHGDGPQPVADASAPLLHGIAVGKLAGRQSVADPGPRVVIRQLLSEAAFTGDLVLTSEQGAGLRMDGQGATTPITTGEAAKGLTGAAPTLERRVMPHENGYLVEYVLGNAGIDERGIPGVRLASAQGLLVETDQYGRYHLPDVEGATRGYRNFILKVDPSTLPVGTGFTSDNPLVRRITPGMPARFDFGVRLPVQEIPGARQTLELDLGEVVFAPGSDRLRQEYQPVVERLAAQVEAHGGGTVSIVAEAETQALAFARAATVRDALAARLPAEVAAAVQVDVSTRERDLVAGLTSAGAVLGTVLFDTDRASLRPGAGPLLDAIAERIEREGGAIAIVGHTDVRGSHAYNARLGLARARAVFEAVAARLGPEARAGLRVESSEDTHAPIGPVSK